MPDRRNLRIDGIAWLLLFCGLFVALCVLSQEPAASGSAASNLLGPPGAMLAHELYASLGSAVYVLLTAWFVLVLMLLVRKSWLRWCRRLAGWLILLPCSAIAADYPGDQWLPGPIYGSGGTLGASLCDLLQSELPGLLGIVVFTAVSFAGIFLAADFVIRGILDAIYWICFALSFCLALVVNGFARIRSPFVRTPKKPIPIMTPPKPKLNVPIQHHGFATKTQTEKTEAAPPVLPINRMGLSTLPEQTFEDFELPPLTLLEDPEPFPFEQHDQKLRDQRSEERRVGKESR